MSRVSVLALVAVLMGALPVTRATRAHANEPPVHEFAIVMVDPPSPALPADQSPQKLQEETPPWRPQLLGAQSTIIGQHLYPLHSPYSSNLSLRTDGDTQTTKTFGAYFGMALARNLQAYLDFEMFKGAGISNATGLGGLTDGDVVRQGANDLGKGPYVARRYLRYVLPLGDDRREVGRAQDQVPGTEALSRLEFKIGTMAVVDDLDRNRYANSPRTEFQNWSLMNNAAWDFNADTRGFTNGIMVGYIRPHWALRFGVYQMPSEANGQDLDAPLSRARGENLELTLQPGSPETVVRLLTYRNIARMGIYRDAIARGIAQGAPPDIVAEDKDGRKKYGFGINIEQPLADDGETGLFARLGWNDGKTETFAFTEVDRTVTLGAQVAGKRWQRAEDRLGVAYVVNGLSADHRDYLAAGGQGFVIGDGALTYGTERILEAYYRMQLGKYAQLSPDIQYIQNPGYNRDRGPAGVAGLRLHFEY